MLLQPTPPPGLLPSAHGLPSDEHEAAAFGALFPHPPVSPLTDMGISPSEAMLSPALNSVPFSVAGAALAADAPTTRSHFATSSTLSTGLGVSGVAALPIGSPTGLASPVSATGMTASPVPSPLSAEPQASRHTLSGSSVIKTPSQTRLHDVGSDAMPTAPPAPAEEAVAAAIIEEARPAASSISIDGAVITGSEVATALASLDLLADAIVATPSVSSSMASLANASTSGSRTSPSASRPMSIFRESGSSLSNAGSPRSPAALGLAQNLSPSRSHLSPTKQSVPLSPSPSSAGASRLVSSPLPFPQSGAPGELIGSTSFPASGLDLPTSLGLALQGNESPYSTRASGSTILSQAGGAGSPSLPGSGMSSPYGRGTLGLGLPPRVPGPGLPTVDSAIPSPRSLSMYSTHSPGGLSRSTSPVATRTARNPSTARSGSAAGKARPKSMIIDKAFDHTYGSPTSHFGTYEHKALATAAASHSGGRTKGDASYPLPGAADMGRQLSLGTPHRSPATSQSPTRA
ncbi:hypothetical protein V8E36_001483 [Tilletia maclaganii]